MGIHRVTCSAFLVCFLFFILAVRVSLLKKVLTSEQQNQPKCLWVSYLQTPNSGGNL